MYVTSLLGSWGEFLMRDLVQTSHPHQIQCCSKTNSGDHGECFGKIDSEMCVQYTRSVPAIDEGQCQYGNTIEPNLT